MFDWSTAVRRELERFRQRTGATEFSLEDFYVQARPRVRSQFPDSDSHEAQIRQNLQDLEEAGEVDRIEDGHYQIRRVDIEEDQLRSVTEVGKEIIEAWYRVASTYATGERFDLDSLYDTAGLRSDAESFVTSPSEETFTALWDRLNSASRRGSGTNIYEKWTEDHGREPDGLADLVDEIRTADAYDEEWEEQIGAKWTVRELYGQLHIEDTPSITGKSARGLELFGYPSPSSYEEARTYFEDFKLDYQAICGHATEGTEHEATENVEIDQLLRVIAEIDKDDLDDFDGPGEVEELYELIVTQRRMATPAMIGPQPRELGLNYVLREIASRYPPKEDISGDESERSVANYPRLQGWLTSEAEAVLEEIVATTNLNYKIRAGMGQGTLAYDPYVSIFDEDHSTSTRYGLYVVYLFDPTEEEVYLTLNQGAEEATKASHCAESGINTYDILEQSAQMYREDIKPDTDRFIGAPAGLTHDTTKARKYNAGTIYYIRYDESDFDDEFKDQNRTDLVTAIELYQDLLSKVGTEPDIPLPNEGYWRLSPGEKGRLWPAWRDAGVASVGFGDHDLEAVREASTEERSGWQEQSGEQQLYDFVTKIQVGDVIVAGAKKDKLSRIYGIGIVTNAFDDTDADTIKESYSGDTGLTHDRLIEVDWFPVAEEGLPITITSSKEVFNQWTRDELTKTQTQRIGAATCRKISVLTEGESPASVAIRLVEELDLEGGSGEKPDLPVVENPETAPYYWVNQSEGKAPIAGEHLLQDIDDRWSHNLGKLEPDDIVFNYHDQELLGYSTVKSEAYVTEVDGEYKQRVDVNFTAFDEPIPITELYPIFIQDKYRLPKYNPMGPSGPNREYLYCVSEAAGEKLLQLGDRKQNIIRLEDRLTLPRVKPELPDGLYYPPETAQSLRNQIKAALNGGKHVVFTGPPGTGKSKLADAVCEQLDADDVIDGWIFTTATAEWTAFDTVGGYMPSQEADNNDLEFSPGQFLRCFRSKDDTIKSEWLIIDELNRSNIDKAFGQLFSVLSGDSVELPYEREETVTIDWVDQDIDTDQRNEIATNPDRFPVTPQWRLLGTMNTADKASLYEMSFAFMRRFAFIHVGIPTLETEDSDIKAWLLNPECGDENYATAWLDVDPTAAEPIGSQVSTEDAGLFETLEEVGDRVAVLWANINAEHEIGPALIEDIATYVTEYEASEGAGEALTNAVISLVYPQLEGLRPDEQKSLIRSLNDGSTVVKKEERVSNEDAERSTSEQEEIDADREVSPGVDTEILKSTAEDMFGIEFDDEQDDS